jgi:hypothetical protein
MKLMGANIGNIIGTTMINFQAWANEKFNQMMALGLDVLAGVHDLVPDIADRDIEVAIRNQAEEFRNPGAGNIVGGFRAHNAIFGQGGVDAQDLARRLAGPRPPGGAP